MTQEEKNLLLKDLCARIPYKTMVECSIKSGVAMDVVLCPSHITELIDDLIIIKPYLRPMESMTEEECKELGELPATIENIGETLPNIPYYIEVARPEQLDWLNKNMFDYRGLIEKNLALEAPNGMYDLKNNP